VPQGEKLEKADPDLSYRPIFCALALFMTGTPSMAARRTSHSLP
jgi:hypothetical protein